MIIDAIEIESNYSKYTPSEADIKRLESWNYHSPKETQPARYKSLNSSTRLIAEMMMRYCPPGRQLSLALTKLEEAKMWANNAISMEP